MIKTKYFDGVLKAQAEQGPVSDMPPFDLGRLRSKGGIGEWFKGLIFDDPRWWLKIVRRWWPTVRVGKFVLVTRDADVREILERESEFITPYGLEMTEMAGGSNFILGMQDGPDYRKLKKPLLSAFPPAEVDARVRPIAARHAREIVDRATPGFDAIAGLMKIVPVKICREYFGMIVDDEDEFADWSIALSSIFFSDPTASKVTRELAVVAADRMIRAVDRSIAAVREGTALPDTPLSRMVAMIDQGVLKLEEVHSVMLGMISGFAPTNLLAGGNCLDVILSKPEAQTAVRVAVGAGDIKALDKAVLEAMRFKPIWIGPWRYASADLRIAEGTPREKVIPHKSTVMPATLSAMFDPDVVERPDEFDPERPKKTYMVYGHGIHVCIGIEVARVQIGECLRAIFAKKGVRRMPGRAGKMTRLGAFPEHLRIDFEREDLDRITPQSLVTVALPTRPGVDLREVRDSVDKLGNPAGDEMRAALDAAGIIHFASIAVADTGKVDPATGRPLGMVVLEFSGDGDSRQVIAALAHHAGPIVRPILERACDIPAGGDLEELFAKNSIDISPSFGSTAGLVFAGTPGHSVQRIRAEAKLAAFAERIAETPHPGDARGAAGVLAEVREKLKADGGFDWAFRSAESLLERPPGNVRRAIQATLGSVGFTAVLVALIAACAWIIYWYVFGPAPGIMRNLLVGGTSLVLALIGLAFIAAILFFLARFALDRLERTDKRSVESVPLAELEQIQKREDHGVQNHLTAISVMKPGTLRRLALRLSFYLISISAQKVFRPGYLANINTIHFARWSTAAGDRPAGVLLQLRGELGKLSGGLHHQGCGGSDGHLEQHGRLPPCKRPLRGWRQGRRPLQALGQAAAGADAVLVFGLSRGQHAAHPHQFAYPARHLPCHRRRGARLAQPVRIAAAAARLAGGSADGREARGAATARAAGVRRDPVDLLQRLRRAGLRPSDRVRSAGRPAPRRAAGVAGVPDRADQLRRSHSARQRDDHRLRPARPEPAGPRRRRRRGGAQAFPQRVHAGHGPSRAQPHPRRHRREPAREMALGLARKTGRHDRPLLRQGPVAAGEESRRGEEAREGCRPVAGVRTAARDQAPGAARDQALRSRRGGQPRTGGDRAPQRPGDRAFRLRRRHLAAGGAWHGARQWRRAGGQCGRRGRIPVRLSRRARLLSGVAGRQGAP
ncbi:cytochrome P450 [Mesorhizobium sp. J428]|uniref:cytochrome P450 n=1 Tax=Mesorhizobium sp. J428 TaxID=2898440 RepID=UPI002150E66B|nr:cytochrome P450 [Mesorhizobium sp. J428]MCR5856684.1 cytochrome P450 [Mesorhizobium sp. J428]